MCAAAGRENYVLWGGREGYDTLLNTDLAREGDQLARFLHLVAEHKQDRLRRPAAHRAQADGADQAPVRLRRRDRPRLPGAYGLEDEYSVNIEANHATLAGHSFHHEVASPSRRAFSAASTPIAATQNGWDTDQFPNSVEDLVLPLYEILRTAASRSGGFNFDAKLRRQSLDRTDLFHAHIGGLDTLARALLVADMLIEDGSPRQARGATPAGTRAGYGDPGRTLSLAEPRGTRGRRGHRTPGRRPAARRLSRTSSTSASGPADR